MTEQMELDDKGRDAPRPWWVVTTGPGPDGATTIAPFWKRVHRVNLRWRVRIWHLGKRGY